MSCVLISSALTRRKHFPRAMTLLEILVAMLVMLLLMSSVATTFMAFLRVTNESKAQLTATANARVALDIFSRDVKSVISSPPGLTLFEGVNAINPLAGGETFGDGRDNDGDGDVDEEAPDGRDNDGDWSASTEAHATVPPGLALAERDQYVTRPDLGDPGIDEDVYFQHDTLTFRRNAPSGSGLSRQQVTYRVDAFDGEENVLVRITTDTPVGGGADRVTSGPVAYDVVSFNCLYWNPNADTSGQYWLEEWDSSAPPAGGPVHDFAVPAAVLVEVTVWSDPASMESYRLDAELPPGSPVDVTVLRTMVNLERVILDARFPRDP